MTEHEAERDYWCVPMILQFGLTPDQQDRLTVEQFEQLVKRIRATAQPTVEQDPGG